MSISAGVALQWEGGTVPLQMTIDVNFNTEGVSGTFGGAVSSSDTATCGSGGTVLDTAIGQWTDTFSGSVSGGVDPASGAFSGTVSFTHSWAFKITQYFTHPSCVYLNDQLTIPPPGSHTGSGTISGMVSATGAASFSLDTDHGPASWSGTGSVY